MIGPRLRADLPYRRIALVLSGGGALGAYEVGVLKVLERLALVPSLVAGVSSGAINAVIWLAHGRRTAVLEKTWRELRGEHVGLHWLSLALRALGGLALAMGVLELLLAVLGQRELSGAFWIWKQASARVDLWSAQLDMVFWLLVAVTGVLVVVGSGRIEAWLSASRSATGGASGRTRLGRIFLGVLVLHLLVWVMGWPWPHRFSAMVVISLGLTWLGSGPGAAGQWLRRVAFGLMPDTGGRGLWGGLPRLELIHKLVTLGEPGRLVGPGTGLVMGALDVESGRMTQFVSWPDPSPEFERRVTDQLGEVVVLRDPEEAITVAVASSAIPGVFEPHRIRNRDFVDGVGFSNQPVHVAIANDSDAVIVVLLTPSASPPPAPPEPDLAALAGRLLELANWRDLQAELRALPPGWQRDGDPARVCVVEPVRPLPGTVLGFDPTQAALLIDLGEHDALLALERAGWLERAERGRP